jgi:peptidoglycan/LPS O-acetylase OafA/YrhL
VADAPQRPRYHALDALRATAMELGLLLHAGVPYTRACPESWAVCDPSRSSAFDLLNTLIHAFRMPVFFLMSGFFAALLYARIDWRGFIDHRLRRIALPLLVACLVIVPITRAVWIFGAFASPGAELQGRFTPSLIAHFRSHGIRAWETIWHLWFLEYLLIFYALFVVLRMLRPSTSGRLGGALAARLVSRWRALWLAPPVGLAMLPMAGWEVDGIGAALPAFHMLVYYGVFFAAGALLYRQRDSLERLRDRWRLHIAAGIAVVLPLMVVGRRFEANIWLDTTGRFASGLLTCLLLYGVVGLFVQHFGRSRPSQRYLSDAAYFVYLTHFPLVAALGIAAAHLPLPASLKFVAVLAIAIPLLLGLYQLAVRHSFVGRVLHGPR